MNEWIVRGREFLRRVGLYITALSKWLALSAVTGVSCGFIGSLFHISVEQATALREARPWLLFLLPAAGLLIVAVYRAARTNGQDTNDIIDAVHLGRGLSLWLVPSVFLGTVLTHLCGGSAGREGAALQMGGDIGYHVGRLFRLDDRDLRTATLCGMAAFFSALFGTPLTATVFAMVVISVGVLYHAAFIPCFVASLVAYGLSILMGVAPTRFSVSAPAVEPAMLLRVALLGALCALVSILFCNALHQTGRLLRSKLPNPWVRVMLGGAAVILMTLCVGNSDYNGAGIEVITQAVEQGRLGNSWAFLAKILFTVITLGAGYKGGEVVPSFFVGATFGALAGPLLGIPAPFAAAVALVAVFCGAVNCPVASIFLSIELFGSTGVLYFALACGVSYMLSGYNGLYSSQTILYSKLKAQYINVHTNAHHAGDIHGDTPTGSLRD